MWTRKYIFEIIRNVLFNKTMQIHIFSRIFLCSINWFEISAVLQEMQLQALLKRKFLNK